MNKRDIIEALRDEAGLTKEKAMDVVDMFFATISEALAKDDRVEIRGLCSFYVKNYKPYSGRNPKTGEKVSIPSKKLPFFKCGKELKDKIREIQPCAES
jgi:integration host factor subunit beta